MLDLPEANSKGFPSFLFHWFPLHRLKPAPGWQYIPGGDLHELARRCATEPGPEREAKVPGRRTDGVGRVLFFWGDGKLELGSLSMSFFC